MIGSRSSSVLYLVVFACSLPMPYLIFALPGMNAVHHLVSVDIRYIGMSTIRTPFELSGFSWMTVSLGSALYFGFFSGRSFLANALIPSPTVSEMGSLEFSILLYTFPMRECPFAG